MNILILGGNGFIGTNLTHSLIKQNHKVRIFDSKIGTLNCVEYFAGDFCKIEDYAAVFADIDIVYHLISTTIPDANRNNIVADIESNLVSTIKMLNICVEKGVKKVIFASSGGAVYGLGSNKHYEQDVPAPIYAYGINKLAIEHYLNSYWQFYNLDYTVLRFSNPYGMNHKNKKQGILNVIIDNVKNNKPIEIWGTGEVSRDYIWIEDVIDAMVKAIESNDVKIFNISSGQAYSINEILRKVADISGKELQINYLPARDVDISKNYLSNDLAQEKLGWKPKVSINEGIKKLLREGS